ncbi:hypothetical protein EDD66_106100 [Mobilisporobacter senegalensis]|uniref:Uncharacterized protein n=1 Tax=Mobilisporobacter senegalensis TaxID=1329262 RepID=A0A3N1XL15_9FIRM|nr:hypothetical protein [Mobilisporobacter senegalensis]ROR27403.1 hypothetical protein EDD66_106100 [Mobilisporobacter senegalensis]
MKEAHCKHCGKRIYNDEIALNIKIFGKQVGYIRCYDCLSEFLGCKSDKLRKTSLFYKNTGCSIFQVKYTYEGEPNE